MLNKARTQANLIICLFTPVLYALLHSLSTNLETLNNLVSWYLPTGLLCGLFLFLPFYYWSAILIGTYLGKQFIFFHQIGGSFISDSIEKYILSLSSLLIYSLTFYFYKKKYKEFSADKLNALLYLFFCLFIGTVITATAQVYIWVYSDFKLSLDLVVSISSFALGELIGFILLLPFFVAIRALIINRKLTQLALIRKCLMILVPMLGIYILLILFHSDMLYYIQILSIIPIIWLSFSYGHNGALLTICTTNMAIVALLMWGNSEISIIQNQIYLITMTLTGLFLGAASSEHKRLNSNLTRLSNKLIDIREIEKRKLSSELHDGLGQDITALKTNLEIINRLGLNDQQSKIHERLTSSANEIHDSVYDLLQWLRPKLLDEIGLDNVIKGSMFDGLLSAVNIKYHAIVVGITEDLSNEITTAVFRTCQECVSNCIQHSQAQNLWLSLVVKDEKIILTITDDGIGLSKLQTSTKGGFGLIGIEERVIALKGLFNFQNTENGATYQIEFPLF
ncbi:MAG: MASE1 domain-containing protein [Colwellia sp.]